MKSLGELETAVETLACGSCSHNISRSPKLHTVHAFYFLNVCYSYNSVFYTSAEHFFAVYKASSWHEEGWENFRLRLVFP